MSQPPPLPPASVPPPLPHSQASQTPPSTEPVVAPVEQSNETAGTPKHSRIALTKKDASSLAGKALIAIVNELLEDGELTAAELLRLRDFLKSQGDDIPAIRHLRMMLEDVWADGVATPEEVTTLQRQLERVLPADERTKVVNARIAKEALARQAEKGVKDRERAAKDKERQDKKALRQAEIEEYERRAKFASEAQLNYLKNLGVTAPDGLTKEDASELIDKALARGRNRITPRQMMVLRFWGKVPPPDDWGKNEVSEWMDEWYGEDPARQYAWELYKTEVGDMGNIRDPESVEIGMGDTYLAQVHASGGMTRNTQTKSGCGCAPMVILLVGAPLVAAGAWQLLA